MLWRGPVSEGATGKQVEELTYSFEINFRPQKMLDDQNIC